MSSACRFDSGVLLGRRELERASQLCAAAGAWLVVDNTYEHFTYDGAQHVCVSGPHVINVFSFSKVRAGSRASTEIRDSGFDEQATLQCQPSWCSRPGSVSACSKVPNMGMSVFCQGSWALQGHFMTPPGAFMFHFLLCAGVRDDGAPVSLLVLSGQSPFSPPVWTAEASRPVD